MLNGLDLFSGYGGAQDALRGLVRTVAYCEIERGAQRILLRRMRKGHISVAPIWDDVRTLRKGHIVEPIDIITGGFPCQDVSVAGMRRGLDGERSGLFFEVIRLVREFRPRFVFLENVPGLLVRGMDRVSAELASIHYDHRVGVLSAFDMGAPHLRERVWILAHSNSHTKNLRRSEERDEILLTLRDGDSRNASDPDSVDSGNEWKEVGRVNTNLEKRKTIFGYDGEEKHAAHAESIGSIERGQLLGEKKKHPFFDYRGEHPNWSIRRSPKPTVCRVDDGFRDRRDRIRALGNGWVPQTAREAFIRLIGAVAK